MRHLLFSLVLLFFCSGCSTPTKKPSETAIETNELSGASILTQNDPGDLHYHNIWINDGLRKYNDTVYEIDHSDTLISYNFLKHLHPGVAQFYGSDTTASTGPRYYKGLYLQIDNESVFTEKIVHDYIAAIDSAYDYYMKNCDERGDLEAGIANRKLNTIIKAYLYEKNQNWDKAHELLIAESQLEKSQYLNLHSIAIPILYEKYGKDKIFNEVKTISPLETNQYIHDIRFDLQLIRRRFRDKTMTWEHYFEKAFDHYEKFGL